MVLGDTSHGTNLVFGQWALIHGPPNEPSSITLGNNIVPEYYRSRDNLVRIAKMAQPSIQCYDKLSRLPPELHSLRPDADATPSVTGPRSMR